MTVRNVKERSPSEVCPVSRIGRYDGEAEGNRDEDDKDDGSHATQDAKNGSLHDGIVRKKSAQPVRWPPR